MCCFFVYFRDTFEYKIADKFVHQTQQVATYHVATWNVDKMAPPPVRDFDIDWKTT